MRGLVVRAVVLAVAVVTYLALFVTLASFLEVVADRPLKVGALGLVGALVAITFQPLQVMLRGVVDELLFGSRPDPLGAASEVAGRIGDDPLLALRAIREALVLPYAALRVDGAEEVASGTATTHTRTFVLDGSSGELVVGLRPGDLTFSSDDEHVLRLTVPLLAQTLRARSARRRPAGVARADDLRHRGGAPPPATRPPRRPRPTTLGHRVHVRRGAQPDPQRPSPCR